MLPYRYDSCKYWTQTKIHNLELCGNIERLKISRRYLEHLKSELPSGGLVFHQFLPTVYLGHRYVGWIQIYLLFLISVHCICAICTNPTVIRLDELLCRIPKRENCWTAEALQANSVCIYLKKVCHTSILDLLDIHYIENILFISLLLLKHFVFSQLYSLFMCNNPVAIWKCWIDHAWILREHSTAPFTKNS